MILEQLRNDPDVVFVYGANLAGRHGAGSALEAVKHWGAEYGKIGFCGRSYGIPTKDADLKTLPLETIAEHVNQFVEFAEANPQYRYYLVAIGTGLAGYSPYEVATTLEYATKLGISDSKLILDPVLEDAWLSVVNDSY